MDKVKAKPVNSKPEPRMPDRFAPEIILTQEAMERAGLHMHTDDRQNVIIRGTMELSDSQMEALYEYADAMRLSPADADEILDHTIQLILWTSTRRAMRG